METLPVKPDRLAELEEFARRRGKSTADALDDVLAEYLEWERQDYQEPNRLATRGVLPISASSVGDDWQCANFATRFVDRHDRTLE